MAKSSLNLKSGSAKSLELDFLRLIYAVARLRAEGKCAKGFLLVLSPKAKRRVETWTRKYEAAKDVEVVSVSLRQFDLMKLKLEKRNNAEGITKAKGKHKLSRADFGAQIGERKLRDEIRKRFPKIRELLNKEAVIFGIRWDFCGIHISDGGSK